MGLKKLSSVYSVQMDSILCDMDFNCRAEITSESVTELAQSIEVNGLQTPIHIQPYSHPYSYRVIAGHRRYIACRLLERTHIQALICENINEQHARILNLSENMDRKDLTPYEEAMALVKIFPPETTLTKMSQILNRSREWCRRRRLIAELPEHIRIGFYDRTLGIRDVVVLSTLPKSKREHAAGQLLEQRKKSPKHDLPMGSVSQEHPHRGTQEIQKLMQYFASKKINGLPRRLLLWTLGRGSTLEIKKITREAEKDYSKALYK